MVASWPVIGPTTAMVMSSAKRRRAEREAESGRAQDCSQFSLSFPPLMQRVRRGSAPVMSATARCHFGSIGRQASASNGDGPWTQMQKAAPALFRPVAAFACVRQRPRRRRLPCRAVRCRCVLSRPARLRARLEPCRGRNPVRCQCIVIHSRASRSARAMSGFDIVRRQFGAQFRGAGRALDRGDVEPFVGGDDVDLAVAAGRIHHAQFEKDVGLGVRAHRAEAGFKHFKTCHFSSPVCLPRAGSSVSPELLFRWFENAGRGLNPPLNGVLNLRKTKLKQEVNAEIIKDTKAADLPGFR